MFVARVGYFLFWQFRHNAGFAVCCMMPYYVDGYGGVAESGCGDAI